MIGRGPSAGVSGRPLSFHLSNISPDRASRSLMIAPLDGAGGVDGKGVAARATALGGVGIGTGMAGSATSAGASAVAIAAADDPAGTCSDGAADWVARSRAARNQVVRMSLELRIVVSIDH